MNNHYLPSNNLSQQLYQTQTKDCPNLLWDATPCCYKSHKLGEWFTSAPVNTSTITPCIEDAFVKQCLLSQHYTYLSGNNKLK